MFIPVVDKNQNPLMPTTPSRARRWIRDGKATPFWKKGLFCIRLNFDPSGYIKEPVVVGVDPGSKKEAFTVKSESHTYLNIQADAVTWVTPLENNTFLDSDRRQDRFSNGVKDAVKIRREMRNNRRQRKTPYRKCRWNRKIGGILPSTKARWQWKLRVCGWLSKIYPITDFVIEDIKARTQKNKRKWNISFSPLEVGKKWFYAELEKLGKVHLKLGYETKEERDRLGLTKNSNKLSNSFNTHCVDSWVLANWYIGGHIKPDNTDLIEVFPLRFHRRQLHYLQPLKGGVRRPYGGTRSLGFKRGSLIKHSKYGIVYVGGTSRNRISLHSINSGKRLSTHIKPEDCKFLSYNAFGIRRGSMWQG